jgi:hypothetical protein
MPPALTQSQREQITAALFRQEPYPQICSAYNVSDRQLRRVAHCLRTFGTTAPPKKESTKPMGRPRKMNDEMLEVRESCFAALFATFLFIDEARAELTARIRNCANMLNSTRWPG